MPMLVVEREFMFLLVLNIRDELNFSYFSSLTFSYSQTGLEAEEGVYPAKEYGGLCCKVQGPWGQWQHFVNALTSAPQPSNG